MSKTIFSAILAGEAAASFVYRDDIVTAFLDMQPINPGHTLVVPNIQASSLAELDEETAGHMFKIAKKIAQAIRGTDLQCEGVNMLLADGEAAGPEVFHVHLHVFPRYRGDGFRLKFPEKHKELPGRHELEMIAEKIREVFPE